MKVRNQSQKIVNFYDNILMLLLFFAFYPSQMYSQDTWIQKTDFGGTARFDGLAISTNTKIYFGTGRDQLNNHYEDFWEYDPSSNVWTQKANYGGGNRSSMAVFILSSYIFAGTGTDGSNDYFSMYKYNPSTNIWSNVASYPGSGSNYCSALTISSKGYFGLGFTSGINYSDWYEYDPTLDTWTQKAHFSGASRRGAFEFVINNLGYVGLGMDNTQGFTDLFEYNPINNSWISKTSFPSTNRSLGSNFIIGNKAYIANGISFNGTKYKELWEYDVSLNTWTQKQDFTGAPSYYTVNGTYGNLAYVGTGLTNWGVETNQWYQYTPGTTPSVNTTVISSIATTTASCGGDVIFDGNYAVTARGLVWSTSANPTVVSQPGGGITSNGTGNGIFTSSLTGLTAGTQYYYRAYATNSQGTSYGEQYTFTTTQTGGTWARQTDFPLTGREGAAGFEYNNIGYVANGSNSAFNKDVWSYDPNTCKWTQKNDFGGVARYQSGSVSLNSKSYILGGYDLNSNYLQDFWEYNPSTDLWTQKANIPSGSRFKPTIFALGSYIYAGLGAKGSGTPNYQKDFYQYDPTGNTWTAKANFGGSARLGTVYFATSTNGYAGLGYDNTGSYKNDFWEYDPVGNTWTQRANYTGNSRDMAKGFSINNKGFVLTGIQSNGTTNTTDNYEYDPVGNTWSARTPFPGSARYATTGFVLNDVLYVGMGYNGSYLSDFYSYKPNSEPTITTTAISSIATTSASSGGNVTATGGEAVTARGLVWSTSTNTPTTSSYDGITTNGTGTGAFTQTINALCPGTTYYVRAYATNANGTSYGATESFTTSASAGDIWVQKNDIGGSNSGGSVFHVNEKIYCITNGGISTPSETWEFDYNSNVWTQKVDFIGQGRSAMSGFVLNNKIYTGCGSNTAVLSDFYEYNPLTNVWTAKASFPGAARTQSVGFAIGTKGYLGGGRTCCAPLNDYYEYNPTLDSWSGIANYPGTGVYSNVSFVIDNIAYILTGQDIGATYFAEFYSYNPLTNTWNSKGSFPGGSRTASSAFVVGQKAYIGFGYNGSYKNDVWEYDADNDLWIVQNNFPASARQSANAISIGDKVYIFGGYNGSNLSETYEYTPSTIPQFISGSIGSITNSGSVVSATYDANFNGCITSSVIQHGLVWHTATAPTTSTNTGLYNAGSGTSDIINYNITGLNANTTYYVRSFSTSAQGTRYGNERSFTTLAGVSTVSTATISSISTTSASSGGNITNDGGSAVTARGLVWSASTNTPTTSSYEGITTNGTGTGAFTQTINALCPGTTYYVRAYATNANGTSYGATESFTTSASAGDIWVQKASFPNTRIWGFAVSTETKGYHGCGYDGSSHYNDFWEYDPSSNVWTQKANYNGSGRVNLFRFSINNEVFIGMGSNGVSIGSDFNKYNPITNTWSSLTAFGGGTRASGSSFAINGKGYAGLGYDNSIVYKNDIWEYNPTTNSWTQKNNFIGAAREQVFEFVINNEGFVGSGNGGGSYSDVYKFNPIANSWTEVSDFPGNSGSQSDAFTIGNKAYVTSTNLNSDIYEYDATKDFWRKQNNYAGGNRTSVKGFSIGNKGYLGFGHNGSSIVTDFYEYTPSTIPLFFSSEASNILQNTASISVTYDDNFNGCYNVSITNRGLVWDINPNPTTSTNEDMQSFGSGNSDFTFNFENLTPSSTYYVRGFTTTANGTVYGNSISFTTLAPTAPVIGTLVNNGVGDDAIALSVVLSSNGGLALTNSGYIYSTSPNPDINNYSGGAVLSSNLSVGNNNYTMSGLSPETTYYIVSFAENSIGISYSNALTVTTNAESDDDDNDNISDIDETSGPNNGDGNGDGIPDGLQANIASFMFDGNGNFITVEATNCASLTDVKLYNKINDPKWYYPFGSVEFSVPCGQVEMKVFYHSASDLTNYVYRKTNAVGEWGTYEGVVFGKETIGGRVVATAMFPLKDGSQGDADGLTNGKILDPGGPAVPVTANIPFWDWWWVLILGFGVIVVYKKVI